MSKTLFNTNTFQSKTLQNSNTIDIGESNMTNFTATNATITNLVNAELQAATSGVATNTSAISNITSITPAQAQAIVDNSSKTGITTEQAQAIVDNSSKTGITTEQATAIESIATNATNITLNASNISINATNISNNTTDIGNNTTAIANNASAITNNTTVIGNNTTNIANNASAIANNTTNIANKQDEINASNRLDANLIGDGSVSDTNYNFLNSVTSNIQDQLSFNAFATVDNTNNINTNTSSISTNSTRITNNATAITNNAAAINNNTTAISTNATAINNNTTAISTNTNAISTINTNIEGITASSNISTIDNQVVITMNDTPQLVLQRPTNGGDTTMRIIGKRNGSQTDRQTQIDLQNNDDGVINNLCSIVGRVTNRNSNIGGMEILNYADGTTPSIAFTMNANGNFNLGGSFQNTYKVKVNGTMNVVDTLHYIPQMTTYTFDKAIVINSKWGKQARQNQLDTTRRSGVAFSTHNNGKITFTSTGTYKIKVTGNLQSIDYNDRLAFAIYLVFIDSSDDLVTDYFENEKYSFFSWIYSRNTSDGAHGNLHFEDYLYIPSGYTIEVRNKLDINGRDFNDELDQDNLNLYLNVEITKISPDDIY